MKGVCAVCSIHSTITPLVQHSLISRHTHRNTNTFRGTKEEEITRWSLKVERESYREREGERETE